MRTRWENLILESSHYLINRQCTTVFNRKQIYDVLSLPATPYLAESLHGLLSDPGLKGTYPVQLLDSTNTYALMGVIIISRDPEKGIFSG